MFIYILASKSRVLYVGVTADLLHRMWEHRTGAFPGFTRRYGVNQLVYYEATDNPAGAIRREKQIKGWARVKKVAMIDSLNPEWNDLAERWFGDGSSDDPSHSLGVTRGTSRQAIPRLARDDSHGRRGPRAKRGDPSLTLPPLCLSLNSRLKHKDPLAALITIRP